MIAEILAFLYATSHRKRIPASSFFLPGLVRYHLYSNMKRELLSHLLRCRTNLNGCHGLVSRSQTAFLGKAVWLRETSHGHTTAAGAQS